MALLVDSKTQVFDTEQISVGDVIYAKKTGWTEGRAGIVTYVIDRSITVVFHPVIANVMNHFFILPEEVQNGAWEELRWSGDLVTIKEEEAQNEP
jgi:hypothetical protein